MYDQISESNSFLSPYATWQIKLTNEENKFDTLEKYVNVSMDFELPGHGEYFKDGNLYALEICNDELDKYYHY